MMGWLKRLFGYNDYASPYYGKWNRPLYTMPSTVPLQQPSENEFEQAVKQIPNNTKKSDWDQKRFELIKAIVNGGYDGMMADKEKSACDIIDLANFIINELKAEKDK